MAKRIFDKCSKAVSKEHGKPPSEFLNKVVDVVNALPDKVFERNDKYDIYSVLNEVFGPYENLLHRKAVMCEALRVIAAFESDWRWAEGVDINNEYSKAHKEGEETGAFQVSWDSMRYDQSLKACVDKHSGAHDVDTFISTMKSNHDLAVEYCIRLLRFSVSWCGTIKNRSMVLEHVSKNAVQEFKGFISNNYPDPVLKDPVKAINTDETIIDKLIKIATNNDEFLNVQHIAAQRLLKDAGEIYPRDGCAITLSVLLQKAGMQIGDVYMAIQLTNILRDKRGWQVIPVGEQVKGDIGTTCGDQPNHGYDHIYLVLETIDENEMIIADNQATKPHNRFASGKGKTPTRYFLRAK